MKRIKILTLTIVLLGILFPGLSIIHNSKSHAEISDATISVDYMESAKPNAELADIKGVDLDATILSTDAMTPVANDVKEPEPVVEPVVEPVIEPVIEQYIEPVVEQPVYAAPEPVYIAPAPEPEPEPEPVYNTPATQPDHIEVAGNWVSLYDTNSTADDAGSNALRFINPAKGYNGNFIYGHNSWNVFGGLVNLGIGSTFTVTKDNVTTTYQVANIVIFEKNQETGKLQLNGEGTYMNNVARAKHNGVQYSLSLMTCHGQSLGHGDATHRLVIFANAI